jgi:hypothetical protein
VSRSRRASKLADVPIEVRPVLSERLEGAAPDEAQLGIAQRSDQRQSAPPSIMDSSPTTESQARESRGCVAAGRCCDARLKQALLDPIAPVAFITRDEQVLIGFKRDRARLGEQTTALIDAGIASSKITTSGSDKPGEMMGARCGAAGPLYSHGMNGPHLGPDYPMQ